MALVEFVDDQAPYLNANNLNNNFGELETKINGMLESGSNTNGSYIKYSDGTMICWGTKSGTTTMHDYWGQFERTDTLSITFPQTFISTPATTITLNNLAGGEVSCYLMSNSTTGCSFQELKANGSSYDGYSVNYIAIGKWK